MLHYQPRNNSTVIFICFLASCVITD